MKNLPSGGGGGGAELTDGIIVTRYLADKAVTQAKLADDVTSELGVDSLARGGLSELQAEHNDLNTRTAANMLDLNTIIEISPAFVAGETGARNINVSIRHPLNAYSDATILAISVSGQSPVYAAYDDNMLEQSVKAGLPASLFASSSFAARLVAGNFIDVAISLVTRRGATGDDVKFFRTVDVPVVANDPTANAASITSVTRQVEGLVRSLTAMTPVEYANEAAALAASSSGDTTIRWWPAS